MIPYDGVARNETVTIHPAITSVGVLLATLGIMFGIGCLIFNFIFRKTRYCCTITELLLSYTHTNTHTCTHTHSVQLRQICAVPCAQTLLDYEYD